jgi:hypothetical protein
VATTDVQAANTTTSTAVETSDAYRTTERIKALTYASKFVESMKCNFKALWADTKNPIARVAILLSVVLAAPVALAITGLLMGVGVMRSMAR